MDKERTFRAWVDDYSDMLYAYCRKRLVEEEAGKDLVQETFLAAWRNIDQYKGEASVKNWLFVILKSKIIDHYRKSSNKVELATVRQEHNDHQFFDEDEHWRHGMYPKGWSIDFSNKVEVKEFYQVFQGCGKKLKEIQHTVFTMKYVDGMKSEEICKLMDITPSNYWVLLHRAKVQLRACMEKNWIK
jgi:RNA polymerase sigma-70 factor (TIGR02943 family)